MNSSITGGALPDAVREDLWSTLYQAQQEWLARAKATGHDVDYAIARVLTVLWKHRDDAKHNAIEALSEWARAHLPPEGVVFSPRARGAATRRVLEIIADLLRGPSRSSPLSRFLRVEPSLEDPDPDARAVGRRHRNPARAHAVVEPPTTEVSPDALWFEHLPYAVLLFGRVLIPSSLREVDLETARHLVAILEDRQIDGRRAASSPRDVLARFRATLHAAGAQAPPELLFRVAVVALEVERAALERTSTESDRARRVLSVILRAWGVPGVAVDEILRPFTADEVPLGEPDGFGLRRMQAFPLEDSLAASRALTTAWGSWSRVAPSSGDETLLRVRAVLEVIVGAWTTTRRAQSVAHLLSAGERAASLLEEVGRLLPEDPATPRLLYRSATKAQLLAHDLSGALERVYREAARADLFSTPKKLTARVAEWASSVQSELLNGVKTMIPEWLSNTWEAAAAEAVSGRIRQDLLALARLHRAQLPIDASMLEKELARRDRDLAELAASSSRSLVRTIARTAGVSADQCRNLFPSERRARAKRR